VRILAVTRHQPAPLDKLLAYAQGYAEFAMRNIGHVPPALLAESPTGLIHFVPDRLKDERAKDNLAKTARLICLGYEVTAAVLVLEAWMKLAKPGETLDMSEPPSEAFDRREVVVLTARRPSTASKCCCPSSAPMPVGSLASASTSAPRSTISPAGSRSCYRPSGPMPRSGSGRVRCWQRWVSPRTGCAAMLDGIDRSVTVMPILATHRHAGHRGALGR
jgi:hypothetical protein